MLNLNEGNIEYVVISYGGFLGVNRKYFAVPFNTLSHQYRPARLYLRSKQESFENYPDLIRIIGQRRTSMRRLLQIMAVLLGPNSGSDH